MSEKKVLLLGNGVNRLSENKSWEDLLEELIREVWKEDVIKFTKEKPLTLLYEEIALRTMRFQGRNEIKLKGRISTLVEKMDHNKFHEKFMRIRVNNILTTNYDYNFERAYGNTNGEKKNILRETKYNMFRRRKCGDKYIWHIHGEAEVSNSISLGHEHYAGYIQKMRNYLTNGIPTKNNNRRYSPFFSSKSESSIDELKEDDIHSWVDLFLGYDVHIIGFSFDYTEIDLWWLTIYKERLRIRNRQNDIGKKNDIGKTIFHDFRFRCPNRKEDPIVKARLSLLESYGVEIKEYDLEESDYENTYDKVIQNFQ